MLRVEKKPDPGYSPLAGKKKKRKHVFALILMVLILLGLGRYGYNRITSYSPVQGNAEIRYSNSQSYLFIEADEPYDLGVLTGREMASEILSLKYILQSYMLLLSIPYQDALVMASEYLPFIPSPMVEEMQGMADGVNSKKGSGLTFSDILLQNTWVDLIYGNILALPNDVLGCTVLVARNANGTAVFGQNFDFTKIFRHSFRFVYHKLGTDPGIFGLRLGGGLSLPTGKSEAGVGLLTTVVNTNVKANYSLPIMCRSRLAFQEATTALEAINILCNSSFPITTSGSVTAIDNLTQIGAEFTPEMVNYTTSLAIVKTNTFTAESWQEYLVDPEYSKTRQQLAEDMLLNITDAGDVTEPDIISILHTNPGIARVAESYKGTETLAFISDSYFALGGHSILTLGEIPF